MTEAPERIWVRQTSGWGGLQRGVYQNSEMDGYEYIRAGLARPVTVAEAAKVLLAEQSRIRTARLKDWSDNDGYIIRLDPDVLRALSQK